MGTIVKRVLVSALFIAALGWPGDCEASANRARGRCCPYYAACHIASTA